MTAQDSPSLSQHAFESLEAFTQLNLADTALRLARKAGAAYADIRIGRDKSKSAYAREDKLQQFNTTFSAGFGVRVLLDGSWGFAGSRIVSEAEVARVTAEAVENAKAARLLQSRPIELEEVPAYHDEWIMPVAVDPFAVPVEEKAAKLLGINAAALKAWRGLLQFQPLDRARGEAVREQLGQPHPPSPRADLAAVHGHGHR